MAEQGEQNDKIRKHQKDLISSISGGLIVILLGVLFLLVTMDYLGWSNWWTYFLVGIGVILIIEAIVRSALPQYRYGVLGRLIGGIVLIAVGAGSIYGLGNWWPLILIGVGIAVIIGALFGVRRSEGCSKS